MKKLLPCKILTILLLFVAFFATGNLVAQEPGNCNIMSTIPARGCAGSVNIYSAAMNPASNGLHLVWSFTVNQTGAFFTNANGDNLGNTVTTVCHSTVIDEPNNVLINVGPNAGSLTVQMFIQEQGTVGGCNSSRTVRKVAVDLVPGTVICPNEKGCMQATATTQFAAGGAFTPSPPYLYTLVETGATSTDGKFCGLTPGVVYHVAAREVVIGDLNTCDATSDGKSIINPPLIPITLTCPLPKSDNSCVYADANAVQAAFTAWLATVSAGGGGNPPGGTVKVVTEPAIPTLPPNILCGGTVTVKWIATDQCGQTKDCSSTFTVTPPPVVTPQLPGDTSLNACDIVDVAYLQGKIDTYKGTFGAGGGCAPKVEFNPVIIPTDLCRGIIEITGKITDRCEVSIPFLRRIVINPAPIVTPNLPANIEVNACDIVDRDYLLARIAAYKLTFGAGGGCAPKVTFDDVVFTDLCKGDITVSGRITDKCIDAIPFSRLVHINPAPAVVPQLPLNRDVKACDIVDRGYILALIDAYKGEFGAGGGCAPKVVFDNVIVPDNLCEGDITVSGRITDKCDFSLPFSRLIHIIPTPVVQYQTPPNDVKAACFYKDQIQLDTAIALWVQGFRIVPGTGCRPTINVLPYVNPKFCGGRVTVHAIVKDNCITDRDISAEFGTEDATKPVIDECPLGRDLGCNPEVLPGAVTLKVTSACPYKQTADIKDNNIKDCFWERVITYKVTTECDLVGADCVTRYTYKIDKDAPVITGLSDYNVPGGDEENGLCTPTTTVGGKSIPDLKTSGSVKASWDFSQPRLGDAPTEVLDWTNGTTSAGTDKYFEGMSVPQRILISGIKAGKHTMILSAKAVKKQDEARHGYDFLTSWDQAIAAAGNIGNGTRNELINLNKQECDGHWSGAGEAACKSLTVSRKAALPATQGNPPNQTGISNVDDVIKCYEAIYGPRTLEMEALPGTVISALDVKFLGYTGREEGDNWALYEITWNSTSTTVEIKVAGHLAVGGGACGYGNCHGAGDIKGNPYHIRLDAIDGSNPGARDNQVKVEKSQTCDVNIPVKFDTPKATDCDPAVVVPTIVPGLEDVITIIDATHVRHCRTWEAVDACGNKSRATQCITVVCDLGANFGDLRINRIGYIAPTSKMTPVDYTVPAISKFVAYPNPFRNQFNLNLETSSTENVNLSIYDMLGKQLDQRVTTPGEINSLQLGEGYPTGIYNLILNQATEQKTVRLLKQ